MRLLVRLAISLAIGVFGVSSVAAQESSQLTTVESVEIERYVGLWHEIARIPNRFQDECAWGATADYALRDDGRIDVVNRCFKSDGKVDEVKGLARIEDRSTNARLKVSFFSILGWRPVWGDYWIIGLASDYEYAIIGSPDRKYGWILSREPEIDSDMLEEITATLRLRGYDIDEFQMTRQSPTDG